MKEEQRVPLPDLSKFANSCSPKKLNLLNVSEIIR